LPDIDLIPALLSALLIFLAAIVRGYSGFGFSLLAITSLSLIHPLTLVIPAVFMMEIAASIHMLPSVWREVHWRSLTPLIVGTSLGMPFGAYALANVPAAPMKVALAIFVLAATTSLWRGFALKSMPSRTAAFGIGGGAGLANGAFGIGGPPVILFYFASPAGNAVGRASLVAYFFFTDAIGLGVLATQGLVGISSLWLALLLLVPLVAGVWLGGRSFKSADPATFRKWVLILLAVLALATAAKAMFSL
jgi:uncharacterized membrane protein YfcA